MPSLAPPRTDADLLAAVLASPRLTQRERDAFEGMRVRGLATYGSLTLRQREWAQTVARRVGLEVAPVTWTPKSSAWDPAPVGAFRRASRVR